MTTRPMQLREDLNRIERHLDASLLLRRVPQLGGRLYRFVWVLVKRISILEFRHLVYTRADIEKNECIHPYAT